MFYLGCDDGFIYCELCDFFIFGDWLGMVVGVVFNVVFLDLNYILGWVVG